MSEQSFPLPPTGGGYPVVMVAARVVDPHDRSTPKQVVLKMSADPEAEQRGQRVVELVRQACLAEDLDRAALLYMLFPNIASRVPEFHVYVHELLSSGQRSSVEKLFGLPRRGRGRPADDPLFFTALIEHVMESHGFDHATEAVQWLIDHRETLDLPDNAMPGAKRLLNQHSTLHIYFELWSSSVYVKPELLTLLPPELPGFAYTPEMIEQARFPPKDGSEWPHGLLVEIRGPFERK